MIFEQNALKDLVIIYINSDSNYTDSKIAKNISQLKAHLMKEDNGCFYIINKDYSIKCLFNKESLNTFLDSNGNKETCLEKYRGKEIMITKASFDVLLNKMSSHKSISAEIVLCIDTFDLVLETKSKESNDESINVDTNSHVNINNTPEVEKLIDVLYFNCIKETLNKSEGNLTHHLSLNAESFIKTKFNKERDYCSINKILSKHNSFSLLTKNKDAYILTPSDHIKGETHIKEIKRSENKHMTKQEGIIINLGRYKELFYKHPSQEGKTIKDFSQYEKINLKELNYFHESNNKDNPKKKRDKNLDYNDNTNENEEE